METHLPRLKRTLVPSFKTSLEEWKLLVMRGLRQRRQPFKTSLEEWKRVSEQLFQRVHQRF